MLGLGMCNFRPLKVPVFGFKETSDIHIVKRVKGKQYLVTFLPAKIWSMFATINDAQEHFRKVSEKQNVIPTNLNTDQFVSEPQNLMKSFLKKQSVARHAAQK